MFHVDVLFVVKKISVVYVALAVTVDGKLGDGGWVLWWQWLIQKKLGSGTFGGGVWGHDRVEILNFRKYN